MATILRRGNKLWMQVKDETGKWVRKPTGLSVGQERKAMDVAARGQRLLDPRRTDQRSDDGPVTVAAYAKRWIEDRKKLELVTASDDDARLQNRALPILGALRLEEVRPRHVRDLVLKLRTDGKLAPRTIRHVYGVLSTLFRTAVADELITATPCVLARGVLPKKVDKDPDWRHTAIYTRDELGALLSDERILPDRRVVYALKGLAALRHGEAARLTWRQYDAALRPLGGIHLGKTKTGVPRAIAVHPTLARILDAWKEGGWERTYGRAPTADDLVVPTRTFRPRDKKDARDGLLLDLATLGMRHRRGHDLRRTFISLALADGARRDLLECVTHGPWDALCEAVAKLRVEISDGPGLEFGTVLGTAERKARSRWLKAVTPPGLEPGFSA